MPHIILSLESININLIMQNLLTCLLETIVVYAIVNLILYCACRFYADMYKSEDACFAAFDSGIKQIMSVSVEPQLDPLPKLDSLQSMREYIKADVNRQDRINSWLDKHDGDRRRKADLQKAILAIQ